jgi:hypothetical protein
MDLTSILIDVKNINLEQHSLLLKLLKKESLKKAGIILILPKHVLNTLESKNKGSDRISYINTVHFINSIRGFCYINYDYTKKKCEIFNVSTCLNKDTSSLSHKTCLDYITKNIYENFKEVDMIWMHIDSTNIKDNILKDVVKAKFKHPYICKDSLVLKNENPSKNGLCMSRVRESDMSFKSSHDHVMEETNYVLEQSKKSVCKLCIKFSRDTIDFLKNLCFTGKTTNKDGTFSQKEMAGMFDIKYIKNNIFTVEVDKKRLIYGEEEGVDITRSRYNFHSHPKEAYDRNKVKVGWPSGNDYLGFLNANKQYNTSFHVVVSIEGLYIISFAKEALKNIEQLKSNKTLNNFILDKYDHFKKNMSINTYMKTVNNTKYKKTKLFCVDFMTWEKLKGENNGFDIYYGKTIDNIGENCFAKNENIEAYYSIHS